MKQGTAWRGGAGCVGMLVLFAAAPVSAGTTTQVALCPFGASAALQKDATELRESVELVAGKSLNLAAPAKVQGVVGASGCQGTVEDLAPVAAQTQSAYALYGAFDTVKGKVLLTWRLVSRTGQLVAPAPNAKPTEILLKGKGALAAVRAALPVFFNSQVRPNVVPMQVSEEPTASARPVLVSPDVPFPDATSKSVRQEVTPVPPPLVSVQSPGGGLNVMRVAGFGVLGLGVLAEVGALIAGVGASADQNALKPRLDAQGRIPVGDETAVALHQRLVARGNWTVGLAAGGGAALIVGALLVGLAGGSKDTSAGQTTTRVEVSLTSSSASVGLVGRF